MSYAITEDYTPRATDEGLDISRIVVERGDVILFYFKPLYRTQTYQACHLFHMLYRRVIL
jgi:hypothetical protein